MTSEQCKVCGKPLTLGDREDVAWREEEGVWVHKRASDCLVEFGRRFRALDPRDYVSNETLNMRMVGEARARGHLMESVNLAGAVANRAKAGAIAAVVMASVALGAAIVAVGLAVG